MPTPNTPSTLPGTEEISIDELFEELTREETPAAGDGYRVILYNDDWHSEDEVALQLVKATGYDLDKCWIIMLETHTKGRAICYRGERSACQRVAKVLREIRLQVEVDCD
ncbi:MAG: ATP-dependent Clp protease adaptor protein ClpS [Abditibacteriota bacterium]|nr:ATP-dependent Clp protease adaptor protein ClpS [Abditibacteriota bacterium]